MKIQYILTICAVLFFTGCASTGSKINPATLELAVGVASDASALVLQKNPKAAPVLRSLSAGLDAVLTKKTLTPEEVKAFVILITQDANLTPAEQLLIGRAVQRTHGILITYFGTPELNIENPQVRAALERIRTAINDTLALYDVLKA